MSDICQDCRVELTADNVWEPGTCLACAKTLKPELLLCPDEKNCEPYGEHYQRIQRGRCPQCGNYPKICGHSLSFKDKLKTIKMDTGWMPNAGSIAQQPFGPDFRVGD